MSIRLVIAMAVVTTGCGASPDNEPGALHTPEVQPHTCVLASGGVVCWGLNTSGQVGSLPSEVARPTRVAGTDGALQVVTANETSCAVLPGESLACWGSLSSILADATTSYVPRDLSEDLTGITSVAVGCEHLCVVAQGETYCRGSNAYGESGVSPRGATVGEYQAVEVPGTSVALAAGCHHTCAATSTGEVYCWGLGRSWQLGDGTSESATPIAVAGVSAVVAIAAGYEHTCALDSASVVTCWGANVHGQLGRDENGGNPLPVTALAGADLLAAGSLHTCAVADGRLACWGWNGHGQLGNGATASSATPAFVALPAGFNVAAVLAGGWHTCANGGGDEVWCWGNGDFGQLGGNPSSSTPVLVDLP